MNKIKLKLVKNAQKGDKHALEELIKEESENIYTTLFYLKKDDNEIVDIMQDILIKLSKKITQLKNPNYFKTWLNQIIVNSYYDYLRRTKKHSNTINLVDEEDNSTIDIADYNSNPQNEILYSELDYIIKSSIQNLPVQYKVPIALREIQGLSYDEISNITNTAIGTVKSRIARARAKIKNDIERYARG